MDPQKPGWMPASDLLRHSPPGVRAAEPVPPGRSPARCKLPTDDIYRLPEKIIEAGGWLDVDEPPLVMPPKRSTYATTEMLNDAEIEQLRQRGREMLTYAREAFKAKRQARERMTEKPRQVADQGHLDRSLKDSQ